MSKSEDISADEEREDAVGSLLDPDMSISKIIGKNNL